MRTFINKKITLLIILICILANRLCIAQSLSGNSGLILIPSAEIPDDGDIIFGFSQIGKGSLYHYEKDLITRSVTMGYLPFLEVGFRLTKALDYKRQALGDRMLWAKIRLVREYKFLPSAVIGIHDPFGTKYFNSTYFTVSKNCQISNNAKISGHLGYGVNLFSDSANYQFIGLFGGILLSPFRSISLIMEYDADKLNYGIRFFIARRIFISIAFLDNKNVSGNISYRFNILD